MDKKKPEWMEEKTVKRMKKIGEIRDILSKRKYAVRILKIIALNSPITIYKVARKLEDEIGTGKDLQPTTSRTVKDLKEHFLLEFERGEKRNQKFCHITNWGIDSLIRYGPFFSTKYPGEVLFYETMLKILGRYLEPVRKLSKYEETRDYLLFAITLRSSEDPIDLFISPSALEKPLSTPTLYDMICFQALAESVSIDKAKKILSENPELKEKFKEREELIKKSLKNREERIKNIKRLLEVLSDE